MASCLAGGAGVLRHLGEGDGDMRDQEEVGVAEDDLNLGTWGVQAKGPAGFGGDGDDPAAGLYSHESQTSLHAASLPQPQIHKS